MTRADNDPRWQLVVFDWDGTVVDSAARIVAAVRSASQSLGLAPAIAQDIVCQIGLSLETIFSTLHPDQDGEVIEQLCAAYSQNWSRNTAIDAPPFDGAKGCLQQLESHGILLAVATGKSRRGLNQSFSDTGLINHFVTSRTADEAFAKPNPQMLLDVLDQTGQSRQRTLMVGDTVYDMQMAASASVPAVGVCWGSHSREQLRNAGALACFDDFASLTEWITASSDMI